MYCSLRLHVFVVNLNMYGCLLITSIWMVVVSADNIHWSACKVHCSRKGIQLSVHPCMVLCAHCNSQKVDA